VSRSFLRFPLGFICGMLATAAGAADWPRWRGPDGAGVWRGVKLPEELSEERIERRWRVPIGGGYSGIAVSAGRVLTLDHQKSPGSIERLSCFDAGSGSELWTYAWDVDYGDLDYASGPRSTPAIDGGQVFATGTMGHIHAVELSSGRLLWSRDTVKELDAKLPIWGQAASPLVDGELVFVLPGGRPGGTLLALERHTGEERWRALDDRPGYTAPILIEAGGRRQLAVWSADGVVGLAPHSGEVLWRFPFKTSNFDVAIHSPVFHDGMLFVSGYWDGSRMLKLPGGSEPELAWEGRVLSCLMSTPLFRDDHLYALDKASGLLCLEWQSGRKLWSDDHRMTPKARNPHAWLVWAGEPSGRAVVLNELGFLIIATLSPEGYEEHGRVQIIGKTWAHPAFAGQEVFARSDTEMVCVRLKE
jgi:outer membrane protein assembly factor BamB